jgi:hypothetical protein
MYMKKFIVILSTFVVMISAGVVVFKIAETELTQTQEPSEQPAPKQTQVTKETPQKEDRGNPNEDQKLHNLKTLLNNLKKDPTVLGIAPQIEHTNLESAEINWWTDQKASTAQNAVEITLIHVNSTTAANLAMPIYEFFRSAGFKIDKLNSTSGTYNGSAGYIKENIICRHRHIGDASYRDIGVACAYLITPEMLIGEIQKLGGDIFTNTEITTGTVEWHTDKDVSEYPGWMININEMTNEQKNKIDRLLIARGFDIDYYNVASGTVVGSIGYKNGNTACVHRSAVRGYWEHEEGWTPKDFSKYDSKIICAEIK